ncbi:hypothetical protein [Dysgonomonas sp. 520]|uniref:hypothetical protein n=1 Tax=Dysgonomonas sp. 520 TaxID=2302931 RepID=UPI0013CF4833|nr:hypothetical protein [Dysgonomonas sp. 520]
MKKILTLLLLATLFVACGDDDEKPEPEPQPTYIDNKLIEGEWYWIQATDSVVYTFENNNASRKTIEKYILVQISSYDYGVYKLTDEYIYYPERGDWKSKYYLKEDSLWIYNGDTPVKYIRVK